MSQTNVSSATDSQPASVRSAARQPPRGGTLGSLLGRLPATLQGASTTQKILGGALLAPGAAFLAARPKSTPSYGASSPPATTLDELLHFVNDRIAGYERAVEESQDPQLRGYYKQLVSQSQQFATDLNTYLTREGGGRETSTTLKGKVFRAWMDAKATVTGRDEKSILGSNLHGEEWALKAYQDALGDHTLTGPIRQAVERQYRLSQQTYKHLRKLAAKQE